MGSCANPDLARSRAGTFQQATEDLPPAPLHLVRAWDRYVRLAQAVLDRPAEAAAAGGPRRASRFVDQRPRGKTASMDTEPGPNVAKTIASPSRTVSSSQPVR